MKKIAVYLIFIIAVTGIGVTIGVNNIPGEWYRSLVKPSFNPPNAVFGPVWTTLYILIGIAGARTWLSEGMSRRMGVWLAQMVLNFAWSPFFFGMQNPTGALFVIVPLLIAIIAFIGLSWTRDRISAMLFLPYVAWVGFATVLNATIVALN